MEYQFFNKENRKMSLKKWLIPAFVLLMVLIGSVFIVTNRAKSNPSVYTYSKLNRYSFTGEDSGSGMSFSKPVELTRLTSSTGQVELEHLRKIPNGKNEAVSYMAAASASVSATLSAAQQEYINYIILKGTAQNYLSTGLDKFISARLPEGSKYNLGQAKIFPYSNIQSNAWLFPLKSTDQRGNKAEGEVLYAISGTHYYYFMIISEPFDWSPNQDVWAQVLQSVKLNQ